jgi:hypothetical protein
VVPVSLLRRFADDTGHVMAERRDRNRRETLTVEEAAARSGAYEVVAKPGGEPLAALLARVERAAAAAIDRLVAGAFPPAGEDRSALAVFVAFRLVLGGGYRAGLARTAALLGHVIGMTTGDALGDEGQGGRRGRRGASAPTSAAAAAAAADADLVIHDDEPASLSLASLPSVAGLLAARTWQLVRFPAPLLVTSDTPVALWSPPGRAKPHQFGLAVADELRIPLDSRHGLILARRAPAGEVVRELDERHARALNRTVAEGARTWMFYHPGIDPLEAIELASPIEPATD